MTCVSDYHPLVAEIHLVELAPPERFMMADGSESVVLYIRDNQSSSLSNLAIVSLSNVYGALFDDRCCPDDDMCYR